ncbi:MAG: PAS domain S-box protein [Limisphaerales bacterium]
MGKRSTMDGGNKSGVSEQRLCSEETAREFEQCFRALLESSPNPVCVHQNGHIVYANPAALKLAGVQNIHEVIGSSIFDFVHPDSRELLQERIRWMRETNQPPPIIELQCTWPNGSTSDVEVISTPVPWHGVAAVQFILHDITEHKRWERQLAESEARFHQLADSMPQIVWMARADGTIDYRNQKFYELTGLTEQETLGTVDIWSQILHPDDAAIANESWIQSVGSGKTFEMEYRYRIARSETYRWYLGRALPITNERGEVLRWFGTCTDIHRQKMTEAELEKARTALARSARTLEKRVDSRTAKLRASIKSMEDFCYSISHNLRAPVRALQGFSTALIEDYGYLLDDLGKDYLKRIHRAAANMDTLILDLLAYGRIDHQEMSLQPIHLRDALELILLHIKPAIEESKAQVDLSQLNYKVIGDNNMLRHIFVHFLTNAIKFTPEHQPPRINIWADDKVKFVRVSVRDNGIGISPEHQQRIFHAFERLHVQDVYAGTGIGLAIARKAAERIGGRVGVESELGKGSCFWVELPKAR